MEEVDDVLQETRDLELRDREGHANDGERWRKRMPVM
jgi:hypothetical protein